MMTSARPYLLRALYDWLVDNELTPFISIDTSVSGLQIPEEQREDDELVLNISPVASRGLHIDNNKVLCTVMFQGVPSQIVSPIKAVKAIYAKENGRGMVFAEDDDVFEEEGDDSGDTPPSKTKSEKKSHLTVVK